MQKLFECDRDILAGVSLTSSLDTDLVGGASAFKFLVEASFSEEPPVETLLVLWECDEDIVDGILLAALPDMDPVGRASAFAFLVRPAAGIVSENPVLGPFLITSASFSEELPVGPLLVLFESDEDILDEVFLTSLLDLDTELEGRASVVDFLVKGPAEISSVDPASGPFLVRSAFVAFGPDRDGRTGAEDIVPVASVLVAFVQVAFPQAAFRPVPLETVGTAVARRRVVVFVGSEVCSTGKHFGSLPITCCSRFLAVIVSLNVGCTDFVPCSTSLAFLVAVNIDTMVLPGFGFDGSSTSCDSCLASRASIILCIGVSVGPFEISGIAKLTSQISRWI